MSIIALLYLCRFSLHLIGWPYSHMRKYDVLAIIQNFSRCTKLKAWRTNGVRASHKITWYKSGLCTFNTTHALGNLYRKSQDFEIFFFFFLRRKILNFWMKTLVLTTEWKWQLNNPMTSSFMKVTTQFCTCRIAFQISLLNVNCLSNFTYFWNLC